MTSTNPFTTIQFYRPQRYTGSFATRHCSHPPAARSSACPFAAHSLPTPATRPSPQHQRLVEPGKHPLMLLTKRSPCPVAAVRGAMLSTLAEMSSWPLVIFRVLDQTCWVRSYLPLSRSGRPFRRCGRPYRRKRHHQLDVETNKRNNEIVEAAESSVSFYLQSFEKSYQRSFFVLTIDPSTFAKCTPL